MQTTPRGNQITQRERDLVIQLLSSHFAADVIELPEFERRVDAVHRARSESELRAVLAYLPAAPVVRETAAVEAQRKPDGHALDPREIPPSRWIVAVLGGATRKGVWIPGRKNYAYAAMGGIELDFRDIELPPGTTTEVLAIAVMGGIDIVVPPHVILDVSGFAFMGGFDQGEHRAQPYDPSRPILRVRGFALMGGVDVNVRYPGETPRQARARRKAEQRARKLPRS